MKAEIHIEDNQNKVMLTQELTECMEKVVGAVLRYEDCSFDAEVDITITDNDEIQQINNEHRGKDMPTDVLSFPMLTFDEDGNAIDSDFDWNPEEESIILGDIVISIERAVEQAEEFGHSLTREIGFLTAHSMLHLLGYDHEDNEEDAKIMRFKEEEILNSLGIVRN